MDTAKVRHAGKQVDAFCHGYIFQPPRRYGVLRCHPEVVCCLADAATFTCTRSACIIFQVFKTILKGDSNLVRDAANPRYMPMVVKPRPWVRHDAGGYLQVLAFGSSYTHPTRFILVLCAASKRYHAHTRFESTGLSLMAYNMFVDA